MQYTPEALDAALEQLKGSQEEVYKGQLALTRMIGEAGAPGNDAKRSEVARKLAEALINGGKYPISARREIARRLGEIGGDTEVVALQSALVDLELREAARCALDRIPTPAATAALVKAAKELVGDRFLVGIVNALGQRTGEGVMEVLTEVSKGANSEVRVAAGEAIANQPDASGDAVILAIINDKSVPLTAQESGRLAKARMRLAANLSDKGKKAEARKVYEAILASNPSAMHEKVAKSAIVGINFSC